MESEILTITNSRNVEEFRRLENQAYQGTINFSKLGPFETWYFLRLTKIYEDFKENLKTKEQASAEKEKLFAEYEDRVNAHLLTISNSIEIQENIKLAGTLKADINKETDTAKMLEMALKCISLMTGDTVFYEVNIRKCQNKN